MRNINNIRLTESELNRIISESLNNVLNEIGDSKESRDNIRNAVKKDSNKRIKSLLQGKEKSSHYKGKDGKTYISRKSSRNQNILNYLDDKEGKKVVKEGNVLNVQYDANLSQSRGRKYYYCNANGRYYTNIGGEWYICTDNYYLEPDVHVDPMVKVITEAVSGYDSEKGEYYVAADEVRDIMRKVDMELQDALYRVKQIHDEEIRFNDGNGNTRMVGIAYQNLGNALTALKANGAEGQIY